MFRKKGKHIKAKRSTAGQQRSGKREEKTRFAEGGANKNKRMLFFIIPAVLILAAACLILWRQIKPVTVEIQDKPETVATDTIVIENIPSQEAAAVPAVRDEMLPYLEENSDTVGVIKIEGTHIDYPVVQTADNEYYMDHGFDKKNATSGSIFMDYRCEITKLKYNIIVYGHHMNNGSMFADLVKYTDESFFEEHRIIEFDTLYETGKWEIFAVYVTDPSFYYINTDFGNDGEWLEFMESCKGRSLYDTGVELCADDVVLTLSTCTYEYDDARFVVQARLVD